MSTEPTVLLYEVVAGIVISTILILLTLIMAMRTSLRKHNFVLLFLFIAGLCHGISYIILLRDKDQFSPCKVDTLTFITFYLMRMAVMTVYYFRISPMIGVKQWYPEWLNWLCVPAVLSSFVVPAGMRLYAAEDINWCSTTFFYIIIFTRTIPSFAFLALFFIPLFLHIDQQLRKLIWKHGSFFALDVGIELAFLTTDSDWRSDINVVQIDSWSMILQQIILVLMFKDAKLFYFPCVTSKELDEDIDDYYYDLVSDLSKRSSDNQSLVRTSQRSTIHFSNDNFTGIDLTGRKDPRLNLSQERLFSEVGRLLEDIIVVSK